MKPKIQSGGGSSLQAVTFQVLLCMTSRTAVEDKTAVMEKKLHNSRSRYKKENDRKNKGNGRKQDEVEENEAEEVKSVEMKIRGGREA